MLVLIVRVDVVFQEINLAKYTAICAPYTKYSFLCPLHKIQFSVPLIRSCSSVPSIW